MAPMPFDTTPLAVGRAPSYVRLPKNQQKSGKFMRDKPYELGIIDAELA
jgi:hypothetical protein